MPGTGFLNVFHRRDAEFAENSISPFSLCGLCVSAVRFFWLRLVCSVFICGFILPPNEGDKDVFQRRFYFLKLRRPETLFQQSLLQDFRGGLPWRQKQMERGPRRLDAGHTRALDQQLARPSQIAGPHLPARFREPALQDGRGVAADEPPAV